MENNLDVSSIPEVKKGVINPKVFLIGLPLFILQLIVVYFVTANILLSKMQSNIPAGADSLKIKTGQTAKNSSSEPVQVGVNIFSLDDIIVNPAGTNGQRLLLASVSLDLQTDEQKKNLEGKKQILNDIIISALSSKNVNQLNSIAFRDTLKAEIKKTVCLKIPDTKINNIYFSKFIIQ